MQTERREKWHPETNPPTNIHPIPDRSAASPPLADHVTVQEDAARIACEAVAAGRKARDEMLHAHKLTSEVVEIKMWYNKDGGDTFSMTFENGVVHLNNSEHRYMAISWQKYVRIYRPQNGGYNRLRAFFNDGSVYPFNRKAEIAYWPQYAQGRDDYMLFID